MAINGPWVGSSAVAETGERWMQVAASAVRQGTPFWMSSLQGRSRQNFEFNCQSRRSGQSVTRVGYSDFGPGDGAFGGMVSGDCQGYGVSAFYGISGSTDQGLILYNAPNRSWAVQMLDGTRFDFNYRTTSGNRTYYQCTNPDGLYNYLNARIGQNLGVVVL